MARLLISTTLGVAMALSSVSAGFAATTATGLTNTLSGQPGVTSQLLQAVQEAQTQCETTGVPTSCRAALQAILGSIPAGLSPTLVNEINEYVAVQSASLPAEGQTGAVGAVGAGGPSGAGVGGGTTSYPEFDRIGQDDGSASPGAAG